MALSKRHFYSLNPAVVHELGRHNVEDMIIVTKTNVSLMFPALMTTIHGHLLHNRLARD